MGRGGDEREEMVSFRVVWFSTRIFLEPPQVVWVPGLSPGLLGHHGVLYKFMEVTG